MDIKKIAQEMAKCKLVTKATVNHNGNIDVTTTKSIVNSDEFGAKMNELGLFMYHAYDGLSGKSYELVPKSKAKQYGVSLDKKLKTFKEMREGKDYSQEFSKITGIKKDKKKIGHGDVYFLKDGSSLVIYPDKSRIEYYDKNMEFVTSYLSVKQAVKALQQSGLVESTEVELEEGMAGKKAVLTKRKQKEGQGIGYWENGTKVTVVDFKGSGLYTVRYPDGTTGTVGRSAIAWSTNEDVELEEAASASLKKHAMYSAADYEYFHNKGYTDAEIKKFWDRDEKEGKQRVTRNRNAMTPAQQSRHGYGIGEEVELEEDAIDQLSTELFKVKNKNSDIYKRAHKLLMKKDIESAKQGLELVKKFKSSLNEKLSVADGMGVWIDDFKKSDAPQFDGKSEKERRDMAIAAYMSAKKDMKEAVELTTDMSAGEWVQAYNDLMKEDKKTQQEISDYILARRRHIRRTDTTGGNDDEY